MPRDLGSAGTAGPSDTAGDAADLGSAAAAAEEAEDGVAELDRYRQLQQSIARLQGLQASEGWLHLVFQPYLLSWANTWRQQRWPAYCICSRALHGCQAFRLAGNCWWLLLYLKHKQLPVAAEPARFRQLQQNFLCASPNWFSMHVLVLGKGSRVFWTPLGNVSNARQSNPASLSL